MFEIDKIQFGQFLSEQRKKKGFTQKDLAQKLYLSDKAVSKWERGLSMPDISLLMPLSDILEVSVVELLEGRIIENDTEMDTTEVEALVKKALAFSEETPEIRNARRKKNGIYFGGCILIAGLELLVFHLFGWKILNQMENATFVILPLAAIFGLYFWVFAKEKLPTFYDENQICFYTDGIFKINMPGLHFNNSNWPYILRGLKVWTATTMVCYPFMSVIVSYLIPKQWEQVGMAFIYIVALGSLFVSIYVLGKKHE